MIEDIQPKTFCPFEIKLKSIVMAIFLLKDLRIFHKHKFISLSTKMLPSSTQKVKLFSHLCAMVKMRWLAKAHSRDCFWNKILNCDKIIITRDWPFLPLSKCSVVVSTFTTIQLLNLFLSSRTETLYLLSNNLFLPHSKQRHLPFYFLCMNLAAPQTPIYAESCICPFTSGLFYLALYLPDSSSIFFLFKAE